MNATPSPTSDTIPAPKRPVGWVAPGPQPARNPIEIAPLEELSLLLGDWRILQRKDGHRWSLDDFVTAWVAREVAEARGLTQGPFLDLGTGISSVSSMMAWCFPQAQVIGVEAQEVSYKMALRSAHYNGIEDRLRLIHADLREVWGPHLPERIWPLVTGTPPYFDDPLQTRSEAVQKGPCRFEYRGGVEDYLIAFERALAPDGCGVICHASRQRQRVLNAIYAAKLEPRGGLEVIPKHHREALVDVFIVARPQAEIAGLPTTPTEVLRSLTVRDDHNQWTPDFLKVRLAMGMPPSPHTQGQ